MDDLLSKLLSFPPHPPPVSPLSDQQYDEGIREQIEAVKKIPETKLLQATSGGEHILDVINPSLNSVPYIFILIGNLHALQKGKGKGASMDIVWEKMVTFLVSFDPRQIRYLGEELGFIINSVAAIARELRQLDVAVAPIRDAILRLDPSSSMLTPHHLHLARLALETRSYAAVTPVIGKFILYFPGQLTLPKPKYLCDMSLSPVSFITPPPKNATKIRYQDILEYFLHTGMIYMGLRDWENALQCLESAITYPAKDASASKIMVDAYKKWVLCGVLLEGRLLPLPRSTSSGSAKTYHIIAKPYETLAQIFENGTASRLKSEAEAGSGWWRNDLNSGLVLEVLSAFQKFQIRKLGEVYSKISIPEVVSMTTSAETGYKLPSPQSGEDLVRAMIAQGELHATLSHPTTGPAILTFSTSGPALTEAQMQRELAASTARIQALTKEIKQTDRMLTHDKEYIKFVQKHKKNRQGGADDMSMQPNIEWGDVGEDEDIMGGMY